MPIGVKIHKGTPDELERAFNGIRRRAHEFSYAYFRAGQSAFCIPQMYFKRGKKIVVRGGEPV